MDHKNMSAQIEAPIGHLAMNDKRAYTNVPGCIIKKHQR